MADFAYAVHTDVCTYLLDETGVCLWVLSPAPSMAAGVKACVGAHFMACVDTRVAGGLVGELVEGAAALFVSVNKETGRPSLLRTGIIRRVQERHPSQFQALLEPLFEDIDVHFEDDVSLRRRESETITTRVETAAAAPPPADTTTRESQDLSSLDRPTEPRQSPIGEQAAAAPEKPQESSPADLAQAQPPPCPDLPEAPAPVPAELPKAAPTLVIDLPQPPPLPKKQVTAPPPLPKNVAHTPGPPPLPASASAHTPLPAPVPPPLTAHLPPPLPASVAHTPLPAPLPVAHTPGPPPLPKTQGAGPPPLPGQLAHTPLPPPMKTSGHTPGPPPLGPALPLPPGIIGKEGAGAEPAGDESASGTTSKEDGGKAGGSKVPKRKSAPDNSVSPVTVSQRARGSQPVSRMPKQTGSKKVPPPPLPPPPRSIAGARSSAFDENAPLPLRRRKKKD